MSYLNQKKKQGQKMEFQIFKTIGNLKISLQPWELTPKLKSYEYRFFTKKSR